VRTQGSGGAVYERLRKWRSEVSRRAGVPAFLVFPDATLLELAAAKPASMAELHTVKGIGPSKAQKYGEDLLRLLAS
jgi:superfamily II DNA helicase RecQ